MSLFVREDGSAEGSGQRPRSLLDEQYRRQVLRCLGESEVALHVADLAREIAREEASTEDGTSPEEIVRSIYIQLYHINLPKLDEIGAVSFRPNRRWSRCMPTGTSLTAPTGSNRRERPATATGIISHLL